MPVKAPPKSKPGKPGGAEAARKAKPDRFNIDEISTAVSAWSGGRGNFFQVHSFNPDDLVGRKGLKIYKKIRLDEQVKAATSTIKDGVLASGWEIEAPKLEDEEIAEEMTRLVEFNLGKAGSGGEMEGVFEQKLVEIMSAHEFGFCLHGDTIIHSPSGDAPIKDLVGKTPWLYSWDGQRLRLTQAQQVWLTKKNAECVKVKYEWWSRGKRKEGSIVCTADHPFLRFDGQYTKAADLNPRDRLRPFNQKHNHPGYGKRRCSVKVGRRYDDWQQRAVWVMSELYGPVPKNHVVHHKNADTTYDDPSNLEILPKSAHTAHHANEWLLNADSETKERKRARQFATIAAHPEINKARSVASAEANKRNWQDPEVRAKRIAGIRKAMTGRAPSFEWTKEMRLALAEKQRAIWAAKKASGWKSSRVVGDEQRRKMSEGMRRAWAVRREDSENHWVVSVEPAGLHDVYDISVPPFCNFAANNIFVHNSCTEPILKYIDYGEFDGFIGIKTLKTRDPENIDFITDIYGNLVEDGIKQYNLELPSDRFMLYVYRKEFDNFYGRSDLREAYRPWFIKDTLLKFMTIGMERYGEPVAVATTKRKLTPSEKNYLQQMFQNLQNRTLMMIPEWIQLEFMQPQRDVGSGYATIMSLLDSWISRAIVFPTKLGLSGESETGNYSQSQTEFDVLLQRIMTIRALLAALVNDRLVKPFIIEPNYEISAGLYPQFKFKKITDEIRRLIFKMYQEGLKSGAITRVPEDENRNRNLIDYPELNEDQMKELEDEDKAAKEATKINRDAQQEQAKAAATQAKMAASAPPPEAGGEDPNAEEDTGKPKKKPPFGFSKKKESESFESPYSFPALIYEHKHSSTQVDIPEEFCERLRAWVDKNVPLRSFAPDEFQGDDFHITVKYGLQTHESAPVAGVLNQWGQISATLKEIDVFDNEDYDVLVVLVDSEDLIRMNDALDSLPHTDTHPDYQPHLTLAYLKKGEGKKWAGDMEFAGEKFDFDIVWFSAPEGEDHIWSPVSLTGPLVATTGKDFAFCPTGEGGGIDNSCGSGEADSALGAELRKQGWNRDMMYLAKLAAHYDDFDKFEADYTGKNYHGIFWHLTDDPNFKIDPSRAPRDASTMAGGAGSTSGLMVTTDIENWMGQVGHRDASGKSVLGRKYVAQIDLSGAEPNKDFWDVARGFGHEIFVNAPGKAGVVQVLPANKAIALSARQYKNQLPSNSDELKELWEIGRKYLGSKNFAFCPTGEGGGIDNSCGPGGGNGKSDHENLPGMKEPWEMTKEEFASPNLPQPKEGNVILWHRLRNNLDLPGVLKEGLLVSKKTKGGEGPPGVIWGADSPAGYSELGTVVGFEVPEDQVLKVAGNQFMYGGDLSPDKIVAVDRPGGLPFSTFRIGAERASDYADQYHEEYIKMALRDGKHVPDKVLAQYPDLKKHEKFERASRELTAFEKRVNFDRIDTDLNQLAIGANADIRSLLRKALENAIVHAKMLIDKGVTAGDVKGFRIDTGPAVTARFNQFLVDVYKQGADEAGSELPGDKRKQLSGIRLFQQAMDHAFCPTGKDGGIDNSCSPTGGEGSTESPEFKKWFGNSSVVDKDGQPLTMYHGTFADFDRFRMPKDEIGIHFGSAGAASDRLSYKTDTSVTGEPEGPAQIMPVYLKIENPLRMDDMGLWTVDNMQWGLHRMFGKEVDRINKLTTISEVRGFIRDKGYDGIVYRNTGEVAGSEPYRERIKQAEGVLMAALGDSVFRGGVTPEEQKRPEYVAWSKAFEDYYNFREQNREDSYIVFNPRQIKSKFNKGTFDPKNPNISYAGYAFCPTGEGGGVDNSCSPTGEAGGQTKSDAQREKAERKKAKIESIDDGALSIADQEAFADAFSVQDPEFNAEISVSAEGGGPSEEQVADSLRENFRENLDKDELIQELAESARNNINEDDVRQEFIDGTIDRAKTDEKFRDKIFEEKGIDKEKATAEEKQDAIDEYAKENVDQDAVDEEISSRIDTEVDENLQDEIDRREEQYVNDNLADEMDSQRGDSPSEIKIDGRIKASNNVVIGDFDRSIYPEENYASHNSFFIHKEYQDRGIARDLLESSVHFYDKLGLDRVKVSADGGAGDEGVGRYAWAVYGFDFDSRTQLDGKREGLINYVKVKEGAYWNQLGAGGQAALEKQIREMKHSWDIATFKIGDTKIGKDYLIFGATDWHGTLKLRGEGRQIFDAYVASSKAKAAAKGRPDKNQGSLPFSKREAPEGMADQDSPEFHRDILDMEDEMFEIISKLPKDAEPEVKENAFCPTGEGGGVDNSCSPSGGESGAKKEPEVFYHATSASAAKQILEQGILQNPPGVKHWEKAAVYMTKAPPANVFDYRHEAMPQPENLNAMTTHLVGAASAIFRDDGKYTMFRIEVPTEAAAKLAISLSSDTGAQDNSVYVYQDLPKDWIVAAQDFQVPGRVVDASRARLRPGEEKDAGAVVDAMRMGGALSAKITPIGKPRKINKSAYDIRANSKDEPLVFFVALPFEGGKSAEYAFCPTGPGGGIDNSCSPTGEPGSEEHDPVMRERAPRTETNPNADPNNDGITDSARVGVPGDSTPPPPPIPRLPNLKPDERAVEEKFALAFERNKESMTDWYRGYAETRAQGPTFSTDDAKLLSQDYSGSDENKATYNVMVHQTANAIAKNAFVSYLDDVVSKLPEDKRVVLVTAGGVSAGKGYALKQTGLGGGAAAVWDTAGEQNSTEMPWVLNEASKRGIKTVFAYVDADPKTTFSRVISRVATEGRMVDLDLFSDSYSIGARNFSSFYSKNKDKTNFLFLSNRGTPTALNDFPSDAIIDRDTVYKSAKEIYEQAKPSLPKHVQAGATIGERLWQHA